MNKKIHSFPSLESILRESMKKKDEREIIKEFQRLEFTVKKFCIFKKLDESYVKRLLIKYKIKKFQVQHSYNSICNIIKEYFEVKKFYKKFILKKYDITYDQIKKWKQHFLIHKDKKGNVKLILIDKDWNIYQNFILQKEKHPCDVLDIKN